MTDTYSIESVIDGVGYLRPDEELAIRELLGEGASIYFDSVTTQVHLCWRIEADTVGEAVDSSRRILQIAAHATGAYIPHESLFSVREISQ